MMMHWTVKLRAAPGCGRLVGGQAAVVVGNEVYSFGNNSGTSLYIDVYIFNTVSLKWRTLAQQQSPLNAPLERWQHTAALVDRTVYLAGGYDTRGTRCDKLYAFDVDARVWLQPEVSGTVPVGRSQHSACVLGKLMCIYGGYTALSGWTNDIYKLDTATLVWSLIEARGPATPSVSWCHSATAIGTKIFVFGGVTWEHHNEIRVFDTEAEAWAVTPAPSPAPAPRRRYYHSAFSYHGELYVLGGCAGLRNYNDMWVFSPETFSWRLVEPQGNNNNNNKAPSRMNGGCCCLVGDRVVLFGADGADDELYVLDLSPSLETLCKLAVIRYDLDRSELPRHLRRELEAMRETVTDRPASSRDRSSDTPIPSLFKV